MKLFENRYVHLGRLSLHRGAITFLTRLEPDKFDNIVIRFSSAICHPSDIFSKKKGCQMALDRFNEGLYNEIPFKGNTVNQIVEFVENNLHLFPNCVKKMNLSPKKQSPKKQYYVQTIPTNFKIQSELIDNDSLLY